MNEKDLAAFENWCQEHGIFNGWKSIRYWEIWKAACVYKEDEIKKLQSDHMIILDKLENKIKELEEGRF